MLQYMTADSPTSLTAERARNGHPKPWKIAYFAVGNEAWGCGGQMSPDHYIDLFRQYANFLKRPVGAPPIILATGGYDNDTAWAEALAAKGGVNVGAISFHYYTIPGDTGRTRDPPWALARPMDIDAGAHAEDGRLHHHNSAVMDKSIPARRSGWRSMNGARGTTRKSAANPVS